MKISLLWWFDKAEWVFPNYRDGVKAAMEILEKRGHTVEWCLGTSPKVDPDSDFLLIWGDSRIPAYDYVRDHKAKKGLLLTTDLGMDIGSLAKYDVVFAETQEIADQLRQQGLRALKAFGTDTEFFSPIANVKKEYEAFYPATFSPWKRQELFAHKWKEKGLCLGTIQPDGWEILKETVAQGTNVYIGYLPVDKVKEFYSKANRVDITGWEGSGRTVIEALSMGLPVTASPDNHKCVSYIKEWKATGYSPRAFAQEYYSADVYASQLLKGMA